MKIYDQSVPTRWEDYSGLPMKEMDKYFEVNRQANEDAVRKLGYTGKFTGKLVRDGVADGYATYMIMDTGTSIRLMHLDWCDGYQSQWAHRWTKKDVLGMVAREEAMDKLFGRV